MPVLQEQCWHFHFFSTTISFEVVIQPFQDFPYNVIASSKEVTTKETTQLQECVEDTCNTI